MSQPMLNMDYDTIVRFLEERETILTNESNAVLSEVKTAATKAIKDTGKSAKQLSKIYGIDEFSLNKMLTGTKFGIPAAIKALIATGHIVKFEVAKK